MDMGEMKGALPVRRQAIFPSHSRSVRQSKWPSLADFLLLEWFCTAGEGASEYGAISLSNSLPRTPVAYRSAFVRHSRTYSDVLHARRPPRPRRPFPLYSGRDGRGENFAKLLQPTLAKGVDQIIRLPSSIRLKYVDCCDLTFLRVLRSPLVLLGARGKRPSCNDEFHVL